MPFTTVEQESFTRPEMDQMKPMTPARCTVCGCDDARELVCAPDRFHGRTELYRLVRCASCSLVWLNNPPRPDEMGKHYGADYDKSVAEAGEFSPERWRDRRKALRQHKTGGRILDLGCSAGSFLATLKGEGWELYGVEMSHEAARLAGARCGANVFVGDILDAPFPEASFDAVTCFHVFEHLYQPRETLMKVAKWLKPGGIFYALMPNIDSAGARIFQSYWYALELPRHLYHYSPRSLSALARSVGLEPVSLATHREVFIEQSVRYIFEEASRRAGYPRRPMAKAETIHLPWRVLRKMLRLTVLPVLSGLAAFAGDGESIHAVFQK